METYYLYNPTTKQLTLADNPLTIDGHLVVNPTAEQYAAIGGDDPKKGAYRLGTSTPEPPEGKVAIIDGYELSNGKWCPTYRYDDVPQPVLADYDAALEAHLRETREARGYTTREPDAYLQSSVPRWRQDALDWVAHRDAVMQYALDLINAVKSGGREAPTIEDFEAGLPKISWSAD